MNADYKSKSNKDFQQKKLSSLWQSEEKYAGPSGRAV